jgi:hypothetical protein
MVWAKALKAADMAVHVTPHGLRHARAPWFLADAVRGDRRWPHESVRLAGGGVTPAADPAVAAEPGAAVDPRDVERAELRDMVGRFRQILAPMENTA